MIGLAIMLGLIVVAYFATTFNIIKASEESQEEKEEKTTINLTSIPTPEQKADEEEVKGQWISNFNQLLKESNNNNNNNDTD